MLEIYMEKVYDLLNAPKYREKQENLNIHEGITRHSFTGNFLSLSKN